MKRLKYLSISSVRSRKRPFSYRSRINLVSIPYQSRIDPVSFSYRSRFQKRKQYGNDTETILGRYMLEGRTIRGGYMVKRVIEAFP